MQRRGVDLYKRKLYASAKSGAAATYQTIGIYRLLVARTPPRRKIRTFEQKTKESQAVEKNYLFVEIEERVKARGEIIELNELSGIG